MKGRGGGGGQGSLITEKNLFMVISIVTTMIWDVVIIFDYIIQFEVCFLFLNT